MIKKNTENEEDDYIIDNDQEIEDFEDNNNYNNNNKKSKISVPKEQNKNNKSPKMSYRSGGEWVKEAKEKYKQEKNRSNIAKTESRISDNKKNNKKIMNFDDMPVGGGGMRREADFNIEIKVPAKKNKFIEKNNNNINDNYAENFVYNKKLKSKDKFGDDLDRRKSNNKDLGNDYYEDNNNNNEQAEMERKNSLVSMVTQTCDREMVGRSEFIEIPVDQHNLAHNINNNTEINFDSNIARLADNKQPFSILEKNDNNFISKKNTDFEMSNFSNINRLTDYSTTQNFREKTENAIQMQNIQRELDNEIEMNKRLQGQIENYKNEFNNLREELVKKSDIINELQQKISKLEKDLFLQGNQLIEAESKPSQEHYEDIVNNYEEMKKNFDKAVERIKMLSDENAELKEKNMRLEESIKKLKREKVSNINKSKNVNKKSFNTYQNEYENENENDFYNQNEGIINEENEHYRDIQDNKKSDENYNKNSNKFNENVTNERNDNSNNEEVRKDVKEKRSIIPEDNDIFGTRGFENNKKNTQKPRKIQEDGIPVIKRMEEKDNVKDIMINNYATNDDDYYNRPPIGKPKARRIKRNNINNTSSNDNNNKNINYENKSNNYGEPKIKMTSSKIRKNINDYNDDNDFNSNVNNDDNYNENNSNNNDNNNYKNFNKFRNNNNNNKGNQNLRNGKSKITTSVGIFPSQIKGIVNEREILELESKLFNLQKERDIVNDEYLKFPEYPKKREEINSKKKLELKLEEMNKEISFQKLKIRELREQNK